MTTFKVPNLEETHGFLVDDYSNRFPDDDVSRASDNWKRTRVTALAVTPLHAHIKTVEENLLPDTSDKTRQDRWGTILKVPRKPATAAFGTAVLRVFGTASSAVTIGLVLAHQDGTVYETSGSGVIGSGGFVDVDLNVGLDPVATGISVGSITRKTKGEQLSFQAPPAGVNSIAELQADLDHGGDDEESVGAYQVRLLDKMRQPGMGGNANDYAQWTLAQDGAATAYVYPLRDGLGTVDVAFLHQGRGATRLPTVGEIAAMQAYIDTQRPVSMAGMRVVTVAAEQNDVEIMVQPTDEPKNQFDWDDTVPPTVSAWNGTTRVLTFSARPTDILVNDRLTYRSAAPNDGSELVVEALGPGANDVTVAALTPAQVAAPPVAGNQIYSGGPLVEPLRQSVLSHFDTLGPARGSDAAKVAGIWEDQLRPATLFKIAQLSSGVLDTDIVVPAANVVATNNPPVGTVGLLTPRRVLIRRGTF